MVTGRIVQFNQTRGYGFIAPDDGGDDVFLHSEELKPFSDTVRVGTRVQFEVVDGQRGLKAFDVTVLDQPTSAARSGVSRQPGSDSPDEELSEVIATQEYAQEITDALITFCPHVTAAQIVEIRQQMIAKARKRGWLED